MAHKGNHICLHRFSFIYVTNDLREDAYICPINVMDCATESANLRYGTLAMGGMPDGFHRLKSLHAAQSWINKK